MQTTVVLIDSFCSKLSDGFIRYWQYPLSRGIAEVAGYFGRFYNFKAR